MESNEAYQIILLFCYGCDILYSHFIIIFVILLFCNVRTFTPNNYVFIWFHNNLNNCCYEILTIFAQLFLRCTSKLWYYNYLDRYQVTVHLIFLWALGSFFVYCFNGILSQRTCRKWPSMIRLMWRATHTNKILGHITILSKH